MMTNNNAKILKAYTFEWEPTDGWFYYSDKKGRGVMLYTSDRKVQFVKLSGPDPHIMQLAEMTAQVINRTNRYHQYTTNGRIWPFKINEKTGQSGCRDYYLDLYRKVGDSYIRKCNASKLHISMYDKVGDFSPMYIGDLIEILIVAIVGHDFKYQAGQKTKMRKIAGVRFARPYRNEIVGADDLDYLPKR